MKAVLISLIVILAFTTKAQIPNWTKTSINGTTYSMYTMLSESSAIVLDFSAIWCGPCHASMQELQTVWEYFGQGTMNVKVFDFLFQDAAGNPTDSADLSNWNTNLGITFPGFYDCIPEYTNYTEYAAGAAIPMVLVFIPNVSDPGSSTLVYNSISGLGNLTGDMSDDVITALGNNNFWGLGIDELSEADTKAYKIFDLLGRETTFQPNTPLIYLYDNGNVKKVFQVK